MPQPLLALTPGEPAGIGPDLVICLAATKKLPANIVVVADKKLLQHRAAKLESKIKIVDFDAAHSSLDHLAEDHHAEILTVLDVACANPTVCGTPDPANASYVLQTLRLAVNGCLSGQFAALVTGPVHKAVINEAGIPFQGHTEYLAALTVAEPVMMLATEGLRVALVTTHLPIKEVSLAITPEKVKSTIAIVQQDLQRLFAIKQPRILVCGLNPHAGESGYLGCEEIEIITPVIQQLQQQGINVQGPYAADTLFTAKYLDHCDAVIAMYHDQGLPVLKYKGFNHAINITLGLPIIRTSVDHGTAFDLAGTGKIDHQSMLLAIETALSMALN